MNKLTIIILLTALLATVEPHGYVKSPLSRTSIFRESKWGTRMPYWWDDTGVWCGNIEQDLNYSQCGRCGDAPGGTTANQGGTYDKGIITATYTAGQKITIQVEITAGHGGYFEIELCSRKTETDNCFTKLPIVGGTMPIRDGTMCVDFTSQVISAHVRLPAGVTCKRCTLRWTWRTSYGRVQGDPNWDSCYNGKPAQTFRNCIDIRINKKQKARRH